MPGRSFEIRFPDGTFEIDASNAHPPPEIGDTIRRSGKLWRVTARSDGMPVIVRVALVEKSAKGSSSYEAAGGARLRMLLLASDSRGRAEETRS
jgi:hypothetical protein